jgi:hypothetical protein
LYVLLELATKAQTKRYRIRAGFHSEREQNRLTGDILVSGRVSDDFISLHSHLAPWEFASVFGIPLIAQMCELPDRNRLRASCH